MVKVITRIREHYLPGPVVNLSPWLVLAVLLTYTIAYFVHVPYSGFYFNASTGRVMDLYVTGEPGAELQIGDQILEIGSVSLDDFKTNKLWAFFDGAQPEQVVPITVKRGDFVLTLPWVMPGSTPGEIFHRLLNAWWLAYVSWATSVAILLFIRPKGTLWGLLLTSNYLTSIWIMTGTISSDHLWGSPIVLRMGIWMCLPVYLHLHYIFPQPLKRLPAWVWGTLYLGASALAVAELFQVLPDSNYYIGAFLGTCGALGLLIYHYVLQPVQRRSIALLIVVAGLALGPFIGISIAGMFGRVPPYAPFFLLTLIILPWAYIYIGYRSQLSRFELRANQLISGYLFFALLGSLFVILVPLALRFLHVPDPPLFVGLTAPALAAILIIYFYPLFRRWVDQHLLGLPLPPAGLLEAYTARITTSMNINRLSHFIREEVLPTLLIRQATLLRLDSTLRPTPVFTLGLNDDQLPKPAEIPTLLAQAGSIRPPAFDGERGYPCPWARLILTLSVDEKPVGLCLLGRRSPDDVYSANEIPTLQALMNQTALALMNIEQAGQLRVLYQADIERREIERNNLALELHDDVLNQLAVLAMSVDENSASPQFEQAFQTAAAHIRSIINGLHPTMLNYGLWTALDELVDMISDQAGEHVLVQIDIPPSDVRYPPQTELHLYRIVQQACQNALKHAHPQKISIIGRLDPDQVDLLVEDDGVGFPAGDQLDLAELVAHKHFGLAGMHERAALIGAELNIDSAPDKGARVWVKWKVVGQD